MEFGRIRVKHISRLRADVPNAHDKRDRSIELRQDTNACINRKSIKVSKDVSRDIKGRMCYDFFLKLCGKNIYELRKIEKWEIMSTLKEMKRAICKDIQERYPQSKYVDLQNPLDSLTQMMLHIDKSLDTPLDGEIRGCVKEYAENIYLLSEKFRLQREVRRLERKEKNSNKNNSSSTSTMIGNYSRQSSFSTNISHVSATHSKNLKGLSLVATPHKSLGLSNIGNISTIDGAMSGYAGEKETAFPCQICNTVCTSKDELHLHEYSRRHLLMKYSHEILQSIGTTDKNVRANTSHTRPCSKNSVLFCHICSNVVNIYEEHITSTEHIENSKNADLYVDYCRKRKINPVSCPVKDVNFYFESIMPKTKHNKKNIITDTIFQNLFAISRVHEDVNGSPLYCIPIIEENIATLIGKYSSSDRQYRIHKYMCTLCPLLAHEFSDIEKHNTVEHFNDVTAVYACEACNAVSLSFKDLENHTYSKAHLENEWLLMTKNEYYKPIDDDSLNGICNLCKIDHQLENRCLNVDTCARNISEANDHERFKKIADDYIGYCNDNEVNPVTCDASKVVDFCHLTYYSEVPRIDEQHNKDLFSVFYRINNRIGQMDEKEWDFTVRIRLFRQDKVSSPKTKKHLQPDVDGHARPCQDTIDLSEHSLVIASKPGMLTSENEKESSNTSAFGPMILVDPVTITTHQIDAFEASNRCVNIDYNWVVPLNENEPFNTSIFIQRPSSPQVLNEPDANAQDLGATTLEQEKASFLLKDLANNVVEIRNSRGFLQASNSKCIKNHSVCDDSLTLCDRVKSRRRGVKKLTGMKSKIGNFSKLEIKLYEKFVKDKYAIFA